MLKRLLISAMVVTVFFVAGTRSISASCAGFGPVEALDRYDVVFAGTIVHVEDVSDNEEIRRYLRSTAATACTFLVRAMWKGKAQEEIVVLCGFTYKLPELKVGEDYMIYASFDRRPEQEGLLSGPCSRSGPLAYSKADVFLLPEPLYVAPSSNWARPTYDELLDMIEDPDNRQTLYAAGDFLYLRAHSEELVPRLTARIEAAPEKEIVTEVWALRALGPSAHKAIPVLEKELDHDRYRRRLDARSALFQIETDPSLRVELLLVGLRDGDGLSATYRLQNMKWDEQSREAILADSFRLSEIADSLSTTGQSSDDQVMRAILQTLRDVSPVSDTTQVIPDRIVKRVERQLYPICGEQFFDEHFLFLEEESKVYPGNLTAGPKYKRRKWYKLAWGLEVTNAPWAKGTAFVAADSAGVVMSDIHGVPNCGASGSACDFNIDKAAARAIAARHGLDVEELTYRSGVSPISFRWSAVSRMYVWQVTTPRWLAKTGRTIEINPGSGVVERDYEWKSSF